MTRIAIGTDGIGTEGTGTDGAGMGLRERKKRQTAIRIWQTAIALFAERGFDEVSVAEIAAAAEVSKMTVFNYFATKEDLVLGPMEQHIGEPARVVREAAPDVPAVTALHAHYVAALAAFDPATGLSDQRQVIDVVRLIHRTPVLALRAYAGFDAGARAALSTELLARDPAHDPLSARVAAAQLLGTQLTLTEENQRRMMAGDRAADVLPEALADADRAFALAAQGLGDYGATRP
ncbi:TetR/AcrR family transcriptional regulator [Kitasatospora purpeofusca]|uniref:TetR/AcrR family transcriptional regulator n=1 Tax=Kitasatospora purpeofusca TaxID=67352 RepID=UPI002A5A8529|nr:TetR family transcriptional regulator [Kitasatospora purpeofusca]MDY0816134.1 TetR family transcriptional regulator [Kitasatospora purpeofusca]